MATANQIKRFLVLANTEKKEVRDALEDLKPWLLERGQIVAEPDIDNLDCDMAAKLPPADLALVLGGDGTMLAQARNLLDLQIPILGVNFGKLGFLAEFSIEDLYNHWPTISNGQCRTSKRVMLDVIVDSNNGENIKLQSRGLNDAVITAGPPFRMIDLELAIDPAPIDASATRFAGDGIIIATPSGSTAHNLSAGGPIVSPGLDALCITPICPQSLAFRPIVVNADCEVHLRVHQASEGTTLVIDGQQLLKLAVGDRVRVKRHHKAVVLVHNPELNYWKTLAKKMQWAARPRR